jgi:hypothetical protein
MEEVQLYESYWFAQKVDAKINRVMVWAILMQFDKIAPQTQNKY